VCCKEKRDGYVLLRNARVCVCIYKIDFGLKIRRRRCGRGVLCKV